MKLTEFQTPTGAKGDILDPKSWLSMILGTVLLLATFAIGQNVARGVSSKLPMIDTSPEKPWMDQPILAPKSNEVII